VDERESYLLAINMQERCTVEEICSLPRFAACAGVEESDRASVVHGDDAGRTLLRCQERLGGPDAGLLGLVAGETRMFR
jgi:hypothetical protein